jgi:16S rRNA A1518/A1519 N6-dimethyltransferase RsmA/KsgA/DIM1 with predicted DNA glycosylase/AP lyase activity
MTDDGWFGEDVAAAYDQGAPMFDPVVLEPAVAFLAALAGDGPVLEFSIGTGRIALPLAARGPRVAGIELSCAMVGRLRTKPGGDAASIPVAIRGMASTRVGSPATWSNLPE